MKMTSSWSTPAQMKKKDRCPCPEKMVKGESPDPILPLENELITLWLHIGTWCTKDVR